jgi:hypothetical protein
MRFVRRLYAATLSSPFNCFEEQDRIYAPSFAACFRVGALSLPDELRNGVSRSYAVSLEFDLRSPDVASAQPARCTATRCDCKLAVWYWSFEELSTGTRGG